jgi:hypothetical protein
MSANKKNSQKAILFLAGSAILVSGVTLVLLWWPAVVLLFKGAAGMILALAGLVMLAMIRD